jgi:hypothetical protein
VPPSAQGRDRDKRTHLSSHFLSFPNCGPTEFQPCVTKAHSLPSHAGTEVPHEFPGKTLKAPWVLYFLRTSPHTESPVQFQKPRGPSSSSSMSHKCSRPFYTEHPEPNQLWNPKLTPSRQTAETVQPNITNPSNLSQGHCTITSAIIFFLKSLAFNK